MFISIFLNLKSQSFFISKSFRYCTESIFYNILEIVEDGQITPDEYNDFLAIKTTLDKIALSVDTLQLWIDQTIANGKIDASIFSKES